MTEATSQSTHDLFDVVVVGAGLAGLYMLHRVRQQGLKARVFEQGSDLGGTWFWNRYPGARCDIESLEYSYQFSKELQDEWEWSEKYATQPEILRYMNHVAERFDLRSDISFNTRVEQVHFSDATQRWQITTNDHTKAQVRVEARFCVMATGCLSSTNMPNIRGVQNFKGKTYHTGKWPHEPVDFTGLRVGIIGTGSSAIQSIPIIASQAKHLTVFQRTPNYSVPARNAPLDPELVKQVKTHYADFRAQNAKQAFGANFGGNEASALAVDEQTRRAEFEARWQRGGLPFMATFADLLVSKEANETAAEFIREKIRGTVRDAELANKLTPNFVVGCKRLCVDTGYYETFNRDNVTLVDIAATGIEEITTTSVRVAGVEHAVDALIFATGFDAMTGALMRMDIRGRNGQPLANAWAEGPKTYLGLSVAGFPNLFMVTGPGSPSVLTNMLPSIEQHVDWIADCIAHINTNHLKTIEARLEAQEDWVQHVNEVGGATLFPSCNSWYLGANVPGKPRVFMPYLGFPPYVEKCKEVVAKGYDGFALTA